MFPMPMWVSRRRCPRCWGGASWQRCRVHFMRNLLGLVPRGAQQLLGAWVRTIFAQPDQEAAREQLELVAESLEEKYPQGGGPSPGSGGRT